MDPSPDNVIDLTLDEEDAGDSLGYLDSVRKRIHSSSAASPAIAAASIKKVKTEGKHETNLAAPMALDDGEVEILNNLPSRIVDSPTGTDSSNDKSESGTSDEIAVVGMRNQVRLPHARQHCTEKPFLSDDTGVACTWAKRQVVNMDFCDCCYCYVCDVPAKDCKGNWNDDHCFATDQGRVKSYWAKRRADVQKNGISAAAPKVAYAPGVRHFRHLCAEYKFGDDNDSDDDSDEGYSKGNRGQPRNTNSQRNKSTCPYCDCYICDKPVSQCSHWNDYYDHRLTSHCNAFPDGGYWDRKKYGSGPFPPGNAMVAIDKSLKNCQHCQWYSRPYGNGYDSADLKHDLCQACGRVADAKNLNKNLVAAYKPKLEDIFLGTKKIYFTVCPADPREHRLYAKRWKENAGTPGWIYDPIAYTTEAFHHRVGPRPSWNRLASSLKDDNEEYSEYARGQRIVVLENQSDHAMMNELQIIAPNHVSFGFSTDIQASWDSSALPSGVSIACLELLSDSSRVL